MINTDRLIGREPGQEILHDTQLLFRIMLSHGMIKFEETKAAIHRTHEGAPLFPFSVNFRDIIGEPSVLGLMGRSFSAEVMRLRRKNVQFDAVAGIPTAITPYLSSLVERTGIPALSPRLEVKTNGVGQQVSGKTERNDAITALLVDDVLSTGDSKIKAKRVLEESGIVVNDLFVFVDRTNGKGSNALKDAKLTVHSAITADQLLTFAYRLGALKYNKYKEIKDQQDAVNKWIQENVAA